MTPLMCCGGFRWAAVIYFDCVSVLVVILLDHSLIW